MSHEGNATQCEVRYFIGHGAPGTPAEKIERCPQDAVATLKGVHLWLVGGMPGTFRACEYHRRAMLVRRAAGLNGGAEEVG